MDIKQLKLFNKLKQNRLELQELLKQRVVIQKGLIEAIVNHANNNEREMLRKCFVALYDNTFHLIDIVDKKDKVFDAILKLSEEVIMDKMSLDALSVYRDYITDFVEEIEAKLGTDTWSKVRNAIRRKRKKDEVDFEEEELKFVSKLKIILKDVKMTVNEFELLMKMKAMSNTEFHKGEVQVLKEVKKQLETSLPNDLQVFKVPLRKLLYAHEIWKLSNPMIWSTFSIFVFPYLVVAIDRNKLA